MRKVMLDGKPFCLKQTVQTDFNELMDYVEKEMVSHYRSDFTDRDGVPVVLNFWGTKSKHLWGYDCIAVYPQCCTSAYCGACEGNGCDEKCKNFVDLKNYKEFHSYRKVNVSGLEGLISFEYELPEIKKNN